MDEDEPTAGPSGHRHESGESDPASESEEPSSSDEKSGYDESEGEQGQIQLQPAENEIEGDFE